MLNDFGLVDLILNPITALVVAIAILFLTSAVVHTPSSNWNDGICPSCDVRYELKAVNGSFYEEYWQCPECGQIATK